MFARVKKSGKYEYLQIVENKKIDKKPRQRVVATVGRLDELQDKGRIESLIKSLSRFSEKALLILSGQSDPDLSAQKIGPTLIFERIWREVGIQQIIKDLLGWRKFEFDVERAIFLTVLHRLMASGSDRFCEHWKRDYLIEGTSLLELHHLYRAMTFLGNEIEDQKDATPFSPRCTKDVIEEKLFKKRQDLFSSLDLVFFDTTSLYFEGSGGRIGKRGFNKDHRPDLNQMVVGVVIDDKGTPICCEMWPGNTADVKVLIPVVERLRKRFHISRMCIVADRGMISKETIDFLESQSPPIPYIIGARMRKVKDIREHVLTDPGPYHEVYPESDRSNAPSPLKVKEVFLDGKRYIVCENSKQARKDAKTRETIIESLKEKLQQGPKKLIGNKGYQKFLKVEKGGVRIDSEKVEAESRYDGKWVLQTGNMDCSAKCAALKYKELWQVERIFRDAKTLLETRPIFHQKTENIRGHVFCSFLALVLRKELDRRLTEKGHEFEWAKIKQDLKALQFVTIEEGSKRFMIRSRCEGDCAKIFQAVGVAIPSTIREI